MVLPLRVQHHCRILTDNFCEMSTITYSMFEQVEAAPKLDGMKNASEN